MLFKDGQIILSYTGIKGHLVFPILKVRTLKIRKLPLDAVRITVYSLSVGKMYMHINREFDMLELKVSRSLSFIIKVKSVTLNIYSVYQSMFQ